MLMGGIGIDPAAVHQTEEHAVDAVTDEDFTESDLPDLSSVSLAQLREASSYLDAATSRLVEHLTRDSMKTDYLTG